MHFVYLRNRQNLQLPMQSGQDALRPELVYLSNMYTYEYPRAMLTTDIALLHSAGERHHILLIKRGKDPFAGYWALPGGFIEMHETTLESARRELEEETGLKDIELEQFRVYDDPRRDPRGRTITIIYTAHLLNTGLPEVKGGDDATAAKWHPVDQIPLLASDHKKIVEDILEKLKLDAYLSE